MATGDIEERESLFSFDGFDPQNDDDDSGMSLVEHLEELRVRIFKSLIAVVVGTILAFVFRDYIIHFLENPLPQSADMLTHGQLVVTELMGSFTVSLLISVAAGIVVALPVILYQAWAFISPGLYAHEKKHAVPFIFIGMILFLMGMVLAYFVLRFPVEWLVTFGKGTFTELVTANSYFTFVAFFVLIFGIVFEIPLVLTFLAKIGLVSVDTLRKKRAPAHVGMWIAATFITPGADIYSPVIIGVAASFLYELTIIFIHFAVKKKEATEVE